MFIPLFHFILYCFLNDVINESPIPISTTLHPSDMSDFRFGGFNIVSTSDSVTKR
jgi:hypothetical protein